MSCLLPSQATGDGRHLSIGQGGTGLGPQRVHPDGLMIPRNAPPLFNLQLLSSVFWDGRVQIADGKLVRTPAGAQITPAMQQVFEFGPVSALPLFPVMSREEMRGSSGNELAAIADGDFTAVWSAIMTRLGQNPTYVRLFESAYPGTPFTSMNAAHMSNAIAAFFIEELTFAETPWDQLLRGESGVLTMEQLRGARNFLQARCSICHGGNALTDNQFHNVALAQLGPGAGDGPGGRDDFGRMRVTGQAGDRYRFRSTPLRNVALTGPFGHAGQFVDLLAFVDHYSESDVKLRSYDTSQLVPELQPTVLDNTDAVLATRDSLLNGVVFPAVAIQEVTAFMHALTDPRARNLARIVPASVPSGLAIDQ
jgi:cytochrome c peroxidase